MDDTRKAALGAVGKAAFSWRSGMVKSLVCVFVAVGLSMAVPEPSGLSPQGRSTLFILLLAAGLWVTEAIPAFAVALLVIGLEIVLLGNPGGTVAASETGSAGGARVESNDWQRYVATWGSPLIWLFLGGFVLAAAGEKTGLLRQLASLVLSGFGREPKWLLLGCMLLTFVFSLFVSNTATAVMMLAIVTPITSGLAAGNPVRQSLMVGVAFSANLGGMGTIIASPPNAIAAGALRGVATVDFARWVWLGLPPALVAMLILWIFLVLRYRSSDLTDSSTSPVPAADDFHVVGVPTWQKFVVLFTFIATILLWFTQSVHQIPATVVSFLPICVFTSLGILDERDICRLRWDVLMLIAGGLSLGLAVAETGLATWMVDRLPLEQLSPVGTALGLCYATVVLSNLMSNTAAANILVPIAMVASTGFPIQTVVPLALSASAAMCLPISTPPNAIVFGTGHLRARDLAEGGLLLGLVIPAIAVGWCQWAA